jgi:hypothetical protein
VLAADFMVINYSRRRRGESGATLPNDVQREIKDLAALINIVGGLPTCMASSLGPRWRCGQLRPECRSHLPWATTGAGSAHSFRCWSSGRAVTVCACGNPERMKDTRCCRDKAVGQVSACDPGRAALGVMSSTTWWRGVSGRLSSPIQPAPDSPVADEDPSREMIE